MPTYVYSPTVSKKQPKNANTKQSKNTTNYSRNKNASPMNLLNMYSNMRVASRSNVRRAPVNRSRTLTYQTTAPSFVGKRYVKRSNGGYTLQYNIKNAGMSHNTPKPKLKFIQVARLVSPKSLK